MATVTNIPFYLPLELWVKILKNLDTGDDDEEGDGDLTQLWVTCRQVNTAFRDIVESHFIEECLPKTSLRWRLGFAYREGNRDEGNYDEKDYDEGNYDDSDGSEDSEDYEDICLDTDFKFRTLSEDRRIAIFEGDIIEKEYRAQIHSRLAANIVATKQDLSAILKPNHCVQVKSKIKDTPIPDLTLDPQRIELSLNWRKMYTQFYVEEMLYNRTVDKLMARLTKKLLAQKASGQVDELAVVRLTMYESSDATRKSRKLARRARIKRQLQDIGEEKWDFETNGNLYEERKVLRRLDAAAGGAEMDYDSTGSDSEF